MVVDFMPHLSQMLHAHLKLVPEDFFDVELSKDNFLVPCLSALLQVQYVSRSPRSPRSSTRGATVCAYSTRAQWKRLCWWEF